MIQSVGLVEFNSIAKGIEATDGMLKAAAVTPLFSRSICPGKYVTLVTGDVAAVRSAIDTGIIIGATTVVDDFVLANVHEEVISAISATSPEVEIKSLGIIETFSLASLIVAADTAVKAANVNLIEIRLGLAIGGKSFVTLTGDVGAVKAAVESGSQQAIEKGLLVEKIVIPSPSKNLLPFLV